MTMPEHALTVGIIDDDASYVRSTARRLKDFLPEGWLVVVDTPLANLDEYPEWLENHDVVALLVDQKLRDKVPGCTYEGHNLIQHLHNSNIRVPVFFFTAIIDETVENNEKFVFQVIKKSDTGDNVIWERVVDRIVIAGRLYHHGKAEVNSTIAAIATKAAAGTASVDEIEQAGQLAQSLYGISMINVDNERAKWIERGRELATEIDIMLRDRGPAP